MKRALLVGINYEGTSSQLSGCLNDVDNVAKLLTNYNVTVIKEKSATRDEILAAIAKLVDGAAAGDTLFFQYSGHGSQVIDPNGDEREIGPRWVRGGQIGDSKDETIVPYSGGMITDDELNAELAAKVPAGARLFCIFDSCHSATILDLKYNYTERFAVQPLDSATEIRGEIVCLSGCKDAQTSADAFLGGAASGALTYAFLRHYNAGTYAAMMRGVISDLKGKFTQVPVLTSSHLLQPTDKFAL